MGTDGFEHVLNRHRMAVPLPRGNGPSVQCQPGQVQPGQRHHAAGDGLVAADEHDQAVEAVAAGDELD